jgi:hypothetical protein
MIPSRRASTAAILVLAGLPPAVPKLGFILSIRTQLHSQSPGATHSALICTNLLIHCTAKSSLHSSRSHPLTPVPVLKSP